ncbi:glutaredoxin family protein [Clostridium cellulovorans]|uniref:Glutaredoxin-like protein, YruB-family n=1 Tax=Clostridium cellulovorans (strain ATCC 35296 / DSM 3052 / OCM 3 / 743B) TaxID=573061 RepID=D9SN83_CLOC7|nr:glutaredoxin family protein [Clostridium cellulovorans]ADL53875.1 glutaredoxin-like protein, YruB-family [Clostridium cellulovorans 743B]
MSVTVYTSNTCPWCVKTKEYLASNGVDYKEINVTQDKEAAKEIVEKTGQRGVPIIDIDGQYILGFDKEEIDRLLNL